MIGEVIAIGDELTSGQRLDTNSRWLSEQLTDLGVEVRYHATVGDDLAANTDVFRIAVNRADFIVSTGGLGPTADDLTREALAATVGVGLVRDGASLAHIRQLFASRGRKMPERNERQADFPQGATPIPNPNGTAPGVQMAIERSGRPPCRFFALPGVPAEMHEMWRATVAGAVADAMPERRVICHRRVKCFGAGESQLEAMLPDLIRRGREPRVGITASGATITLRVTAAAADEPAALAAMEPTLATIREAVGELVFGEEDDELQHAVGRLLTGRGESVASTESWTGGLVAGWLAGVDGLPLAASVVQPTAAVGEEAVVQLARRAREAHEADFGLAIGAPDGGSPETVAVALVGPDVAKSNAFPVAGHPSIRKPWAAKHALNLLRLHLLNRE